MKHYVLMADIINSSEKPANELMSHFKKIILGVNKKFEKGIVSPLTITLGDEFQGLVKDLMGAVSIIFCLDEMLLKANVDYSLRYVVHYGEVSTPINKDSAYEMLGPGLTKARKTIEEIKLSGEKVFFQDVSSGKDERLNLAFQLYRSFYDDWSFAERKIVAAFLEKEDYKIVAKQFDRDISSMWRKEKSLKLKEFKASRRLINLLSNE
jgi:hypothetical protein